MKPIQGCHLIKPEEPEFLPGATVKPDMSLIYPVDPKQLPQEPAGVEWPPKS